MSQTQKTALIVDDEKSIQYALSEELEQLGYECVTASSGQEALERATRQEFDLMMLDVRMPGMSGLEVLKNFRAGHPGTCVVMLTAMVETSIATEAMELGADDYVTKPWDPDDVSIRLKRAHKRRALAMLRRSEPAENMVDSLEITKGLISQQIAAFERQTWRLDGGGKAPGGNA